MQDIDSALSDIGRIRDQLAASTRFRGFTPGVAAATGLLAMALSVLQSNGFGGAMAADMLLQWIGLAVLCAAMIGIDAVVRARRLHRAMADTMIDTTLRQFLPAGGVGAICAIVILIRAPQFAAVLPGLWQLLIGVGIIAALPALPRMIFWGAVWYFAAGTISLIVGVGVNDLSPWVMGLPFGIGQLLVAALLRLAGGGERDG